MFILFQLERVIRVDTWRDWMQGRYFFLEEMHSI